MESKYLIIGAGALTGLALVVYMMNKDKTAPLVIGSNSPAPKTLKPVEVPEIIKTPIRQIQQPTENTAYNTGIIAPVLKPVYNASPAPSPSSAPVSAYSQDLINKYGTQQPVTTIAPSPSPTVISWSPYAQEMIAKYGTQNLAGVKFLS
jgi:hypothetical protein